MAKAKGNPQACFKRKLQGTKVPIDLCSDPEDMPTGGATGATGSNSGNLNDFPRSPTIDPLPPTTTQAKPEPMILDLGDSQPDSVPDPAKTSDPGQDKP
eukprot:707795-Alexandrium_andersonii.AAC.1